MKPENTMESEIPQVLRDAFDALRSPDEPGQTFGITVIEVNGQPTWAIAAIAYDPLTEEINTVIPIFQALPLGAKVTIGGEEAEEISERFADKRPVLPTECPKCGPSCKCEIAWNH